MRMMKPMRYVAKEDMSKCWVLVLVRGQQLIQHLSTYYTASLYLAAPACTT